MGVGWPWLGRKWKIVERHVCETSHGSAAKTLEVEQCDLEQSSGLKTNTLKPQDKGDKVDPNPKL